MADIEQQARGILREQDQLDAAGVSWANADDIVVDRQTHLALARAVLERGEVLRACEWSAHEVYGPGSVTDSCPVCGNGQFGGHAPYCALAKALKGTAMGEKCERHIWGVRGTPPRIACIECYHAVEWPDLIDALNERDALRAQVQRQAEAMAKARKTLMSERCTGCGHAGQMVCDGTCEITESIAALDAAQAPAEGGAQ